METLLQQPSASTEKVPDWKTWKAYWLDGERPEYNHPEAAPYSLKNHRPTYTMSILKNTLSVINTVCHCCGSWKMDLRHPRKTFPSGAGNQAGDFASYVKQTWPNAVKDGRNADTYWPLGIGIFLGMHGDAETTRKEFGLHQDDVVTIEFDLGELGTHTLAYRDVSDVASI